MQRILTLILGTLALWLCSLALAQTAQPELIKGVSPATITLIVIVGSSFLSHWLTALTKGRLGTEGRTTQLLAGGFSALTGGLITFRSGLYGEGWTALLVALLVSLVTWAGADAQWRGKVQAASAALQGLPIVLLPAPASADPTPVPLPAPVEAAPIPGDPDMLTLMTLLSGALSLGSTPPTTGQSTALGTWVDTWLPKLRADVQALGTGLNAVTLLSLAKDVIPAANQLAGVFVGADRGEVVAVTLRFVVQEFAPPAIAAQLAPMLASGTIEGLVEGLYRELFPVPVTAPVVNAPELPSGAAVTQ